MFLPYKRKQIKKLLVNNRLISLTSIVCKLMETIICDKLVTFLEEFLMINNTQHGFHKEYFFLTNFLDFYNDVFNIYDKTKAVDIIYLDF